MRSKVEDRIRLGDLQRLDHRAEIVEVDLVHRHLALKVGEVLLGGAVPAREAVQLYLRMMLGDVLGEVAAAGAADAGDERALDRAHARTLLRSSHNSRIRSRSRSG